MAFPIKTYADIYDMTYESYRKIEYPDNRGHFGHIVVRDSNTAGKDYLLIGCNSNETTNLTEGIRLNRRQVKQMIKALNKFLDRTENK